MLRFLSVRVLECSGFWVFRWVEASYLLECYQTFLRIHRQHLSPLQHSWVLMPQRAHCPCPCTQINSANCPQYGQRRFASEFLSVLFSCADLSIPLRQFCIGNFNIGTQGKPPAGSVKSFEAFQSFLLYKLFFRFARINSFLSEIKQSL